MRANFLSWNKTFPGVPVALALAVSQCWAQTSEAPLLPAEVGRGTQAIQLNELPAPDVNTAAPSNELPAAASSALPVASDANTQVLQTWQKQTGQAVWVDDKGKLEFHGAITVDAYDNKTNVPGGNPLLTPLRDGTFGKATFQGDVRTTSAEEDVTYLQGVTTYSNDRAQMPRYETQINSLQGGRAGPGYQIAVGDVVAGFSGLSSNLGLRGLLAARQKDRLTFTGFAGTVAESWESLFQATPLDGFEARTRYSRDVMGGKVDFAYSETLSGFVTAQSWNDRTGSALLAAGTAARSGSAASVGAKYLTQRAQVTVEAAHSNQQDQTVGAVAPFGASTPVGSGNAVTVDGTYRWDVVGVRAGYHNLSPRFGSLAQSVAPGVKEWYAGGDWQITPQLTWSSDLRHALQRTEATFFFPAGTNALDSLTNRLSYSVASLPGLMLSLSDTRNRGDNGLSGKTTNDQTQYNLAYAIGEWNFQGGLGRGHSRSPAAPQADSDSKQWQLGLGRTFSDASVESAPGWTLSTQVFASGQNQHLIATGVDVKSTVMGFNAGLQSQRYGTLSATLQRQQTTQPLVGMPNLVTSSFTLDWSKALTRQWTLKTYARINHRNHGDFLLQVDERVLGVQGSYQW